MKKVIMLLVFLAGATQAQAQEVTVTVENCWGRSCTEAIDPNLIGGVVGRILGNPEPSHESIDSKWARTTAEIIREKHAVRASYAQDQHDMMVDSLVHVGVSRAEAERITAKNGY